MLHELGHDDWVTSAFPDTSVAMHKLLPSTMGNQSSQRVKQA
jgi:hypothetical protein